MNLDASKVIDQLLDQIGQQAKELALVKTQLTLMLDGGGENTENGDDSVHSGELRPGGTDGREATATIE